MAAAIPINCVGGEALLKAPGQGPGRILTPPQYMLRCIGKHSESARQAGVPIFASFSERVPCSGIGVDVDMIRLSVEACLDLPIFLDGLWQRQVPTPVSHACSLRHSVERGGVAN